MSGLRGKVPTSVQKRLKAFFYGSAGSGKTTCAMSFPKPYFIDTEKGAENDQYVQMLEKNGGALFQTQDFEELYKEIKTLSTVKHDYQTVVIDPITIIYNNLLDEAIKKVGEGHGKHYGEANRQMKRLIDLLFRLDMNVIITSHAKTEYGNGMVAIGQTFDSYKKLDYIFDLVMEISIKAGKRMATAKKSRVNNIPVDESFEFSYDSIASRYGKGLIEKASVPVDGIKDETYDKLGNLIIETDTNVSEMLKFSKVQNLDELSEEMGKKLVMMLEKKLVKLHQENQRQD